MKRALKPLTYKEFLDYVARLEICSDLHGGCDNCPIFTKCLHDFDRLGESLPTSFPKGDTNG